MGIQLLQVVRGGVRLASGCVHVNGEVSLHWVGTQYAVGYEALAEVEDEARRCLYPDLEFVLFPTPAGWLSPPDPSAPHPALVPRPRIEPRRR